MVNVVVNDVYFSISLESVDKQYILNTARNFCTDNINKLKIAADLLENGCVKPVSAHLFQEVYGHGIQEFPVVVIFSIS